MRFASCHPERKHFAKGLCSACHQADFKRTHPEYREKMRAYLREYRLNNLERLSAYQEKRRSDPEKRKRDAKRQKNCAYKRKYGLTLQEALALLEAQSNACALCSAPLTEKTMNVDHCHENGGVRGVLCTGCNTGLGLLGDSLAGLQKAIEYLSAFAQKNQLLADKEP